MTTKITQGLMIGLAGIGLLLCGRTRADISLMDGAGPNGLGSTNIFRYGTNVDVNTGLYTDVNGSLDTNAATFITPFTVSTNANTVLVVQVTDVNDWPSGLNVSPNFVTWSNANGTTQTLTLAKSVSSGTYNFYWLDIYYVYNPTPGPGAVICVETNQVPPGTNTGGFSFTNNYFNMSMQAFTLKGVDTTYAVSTGGSGGATVTQLTANGPSLPNYGYWAVLSSYNSNTGHPLTNSTVGNLLPQPYPPSGTTYYLDDFALGEVTAYGYVVNLLPKLTEFIATEDYGGTSTQMAMDYTIFKPYDAFAGSYPTGVSATTTQNSKITVSWTGVSSGSPTNYIVWRSTVKSGPFTVAGNSGTATSFVDTGVVNGITYYYIVQAQKAGGVSLYSLTSTGSGEGTGYAVGVPSAPTGVMGVTGINSSLLSWNSLQGVSAYYIERSLTSGGESSIGTAGTATNYTDLAVTDGTKYYYEIAASNSYGLGPLSAEVSTVPALTIFTNYLGLFNSQGDMWTPENTNSTTTFISSNDVYNAGLQYPILGFNFFMVPPPSGGLMDIGGEYANQVGFTNQSGVLGTNVNEANGAVKTFLHSLNLGGYQYLEMDAINIGNTTNTWDALGGGGLGEIRPEFQLTVTNNPVWLQGYGGGRNFYEIITAGGPGATNFTHFTIPLSLWSGPIGGQPTNGYYDLSTAGAARIEIYDPYIPTTNSIAGTSNAMWLDAGFVNVKLSGAPGYASAFSGLSSPTISSGTASVTLTGKVSGTVAGTNVYCWQGTPVSVTINGNTQTGAIGDVTGDFSINYTGTGSLTQGVYQVTYAVPSDMVELVGATNSATTLTVGPSGPPSAPTNLPPYKDGSGNLVLRASGTVSGHNYELLTTTNLNPPVVWTTNSTTAGTGGTITNTVPITSGTPKQFFKYQTQ